jgi:glycosyltransferase involved in cell wall biosynthesis
MKSLLILTQYYPPEIGAPQNRLHELAVRMYAQGWKIEVLTAMPNYPKMEIQEEYKAGKIKEESIDGIKVYRSKIFVSSSKSILPRLLNYFSFVCTSYWRGRKLFNYDYIMVESPPLFLGYSAMALSKKLKAKLIFNVSDLWPESAEKMNIVNNKKLLSFAYKLEAKCYSKSWLVTGQTMGIVKSIQSRFPSTKVHWLPNGVNLDFYNPKKVPESGFRSKHGYESSDILFFYGGIIGHAQGLETVLYAAQKVQDDKRIKFILQGAGPVKDTLIKLKRELNLENVFFHEPVSKDVMPSVLKAVDAAVIPLRKLDLFQGAIPSKIFEALAMELPLLLGVDGEARMHFVEKAEAALFCEPENAQILADNVLLISSNEELRKKMGRSGRAYVTEFFNRDKIASNFLDQLQNE